MNRFILLFLLAVSGSALYAQNSNYVENAYVVTTPGDTVWAQKIKFSGNRFLKSIKIAYPNGTKATYKAKQLIAAGYLTFDRDGEFWVEYEKIIDPENPSEYILAERLADGLAMRLYSHPSGFGYSSVAIRGLGIAIGSFGSGVDIDLAPGDPIRRYIIVKEGLQRPVVITDRNFGRIYQSLFTDCPTFTETMKSNSQFINMNNIVELVHTYNSKCN